MKYLFLLFVCFTANAEVLKITSTYTEKKLTYTTRGTGFAVNREHFVTAAHNFYEDVRNDKNEIILYKLKKGLIVTLNDVKLEFEIIRTDHKLDISFCKVRKLVFTDYPLGYDVDDGDVTIVGFTKLLEHRQGRIEIRYWDGSSRDLALVQFDHGFSGGPVYQGNKIIGMSVAGRPNGKTGKERDMDYISCLYIPISAIRYFTKFK